MPAFYRNFREFVDPKAALKRKKSAARRLGLFLGLVEGQARELILTGSPAEAKGEELTVWA